jgi:NAD(P)H-hydrate repair Nnr-like enzyme with NAD(P)H-hydrate dehydratase domain
VRSRAAAATAIAAMRPSAHLVTLMCPENADPIKLSVLPLLWRIIRPNTTGAANKSCGLLMPLQAVAAHIVG